jgi:hypothetical protein
VLAMLRPGDGPDRPKPADQAVAAAPVSAEQPLAAEPNGPRQTDVR